MTIDAHDPRYVASITATLRKWYFTDAGGAYLETPEGRDDLSHHVSKRYEMFARHHIPWLRRRYDLSAMRLVEVGCGTGSSTLAFASVAKSLDCYEISEGSRQAAMERIRFWGIDSVRFHSALFDEAAWHAHDEPIDGILLTASLEHMTHSEALDILRLCGRALRPGGVLVICETPNRFTLVDEHTSQIPLFSMLPRQIQVEYAARSPRHAFKQTMADARNQGVEQACMLMTRWGSGVSFHEFEIAFGENVHSLVTLDGYEPEMTSFFTVTDRDLQIERLFSDSGVRVNRAFTRHYLNLALEKPPA